MRVGFLLFLFLFSGILSAQKASVNEDIDLILHLQSVGSLDETVKFCDRLLNQGNLNDSQKDSISFLAGWISHQSVGAGSKYLLNVSPNSGFYFKSRLYAYLEKVEKNQLDSALFILNTLPQTENPELTQLVYFERAGIHLLKKQKVEYYSLAQKFSSDNEVLRSEQETLLNIAPGYLSMKRKSPFVAGALSAVLPGAGKLYAGNRGQALAAFIRVAALGGIVAENWRNNGITHPQTLIFAGLFSVFYVGNIWGSALSVQTIWNEKQLENKYNISVGLRVPVDSFFK